MHVYAHLFEGLGQVTLRSPRFPGTPLNVACPSGQHYDSTVRRCVPNLLREPPGQWSFEISVGGRSIGTCGPLRLNTTDAPQAAAGFYTNITYTGTLHNFPTCPDVMERARDAYQRTKGAITIRASRNGVYRFTSSSGSIQPTVAGVPEEQVSEDE